MRNAFVLGTVLALAAALAAAPAFAAGFRIPEAGARAMGFANAFVGLADDPSAVQFNPAGLPSLEGTRILFGATSISTENSYEDGAGDSSDAEALSFLPPFFYYTNHIQDGPWWFGLGLNSPFGLGTEWDVDTFEYIATKTSLEMVKLNPAVAYRVDDRWSLAIGLDYYQVLEATFENRRAVPTGLGFPNDYAPVDQKLSADGDALGYNLGVLFRPNGQLAVGFAYRSNVTPDLSGDITLKNPSLLIDLDGSGKADLKLPATAALGMSWKPAPAWQVAFDLDWTGWSAYDELAITATVPPNPTSTTVSEKDYEDTIAYRLGVEYALDDKWSVRGGYLMDSMPIPEETYEPRLPDGDRTGFVVGGGYRSGKWTADVAFMFLTLDKTTVDSDTEVTIPGGLGLVTPPQTADGTYEGSVTLIGFDVGYSF